jgi:hypothetical protein
MFRACSIDETIRPCHETISHISVNVRKQRLDIRVVTTTADCAGRLFRRRSKMRTLSFMLALAFVMAGASMAGRPGGNLPGVGTFAYNGSPIANTAVVVAVR